jgi:hypothetical protein
VAAHARNDSVDVIDGEHDDGCPACSPARLRAQACRLLLLSPPANEAFGIFDNDVDLRLVKPQYPVGLYRESRPARPVEREKGSG